MKRGIICGTIKAEAEVSLEELIGTSQFIFLVSRQLIYGVSEPKGFIGVIPSCINTFVIYFSLRTGKPMALAHVQLPHKRSPEGSLVTMF